MQKGLHHDMSLLAMPEQATVAVVPRKRDTINQEAQTAMHLRDCSLEGYHLTCYDSSAYFFFFAGVCAVQVCSSNHCCHASPGSTMQKHCMIMTSSARRTCEGTHLHYVRGRTGKT